MALDPSKYASHQTEGNTFYVATPDDLGVQLRIDKYDGIGLDSIYHFFSWEDWMTMVIHVEDIRQMRLAEVEADLGE